MSNQQFALAGIPKKKVLKNLKTIGGMLPLTYYKATAYAHRKGQAILDDPELEHLHEDITNPDTMYRIEKEVMLPVIHYRRMRTLLKNGVQAVQKYIKEIESFAKEMSEHDMPFIIDDMDMWIKATILQNMITTKSHNKRTRKQKRHAKRKTA